MNSNDGYRPESRRGRMTRSRLIAAGTSVGALVAITAGVAAANPAPAARRAIPRSDHSTADDSTPTTPAPTAGADDWQQLPPDPSASDSGSGNNAQPPAFDPGAAANDLGGSDTRSGGS